MAGVTTSCTIPPFKQPFSSSSHLQSKFFGIRIQFPNRSSNFSVGRGCRIACRYGGGSVGGGGRGFSRGGPRRTGETSSDDEDPALDIDGIRSDKVRLIDEEQKMVGIVSKNAAIQMAEDAELDLVLLSPDADPPVVKLMDYNKYKYEQQKKKKEQQKKAHRADLKEIKMGYNIDVHDYGVRLKAAQKFLKDGDKVKLIVNLKGRENDFRNNAMELIRRFRDDIGELAIEESKNFRDRNMNIVLVPNKAALQKEAPKKKETSTEKEVSASV